MPALNTISLSNSSIFDLSEVNRINLSAADSSKEIELVASIAVFSKEEYLRFVSKDAQIIDMITYAERTNNADLLNELNETFKEDLAMLFNE